MKATDFIIVPTVVAAAASAGPCPLLGPAFPVPRLLSSSETFQSKTATIQADLNHAFDTGVTNHGLVNSNDTYSIQIFSTTENDPLLDFHHCGIDLIGNHTIDGDSIYRIASTTKVFTVYLLLLQAGDGIFGEPVTKYLPELAKSSYWDEMTVGALAGYLSGIVAEVYNTDSLTGGSLGDFFPEVFPHLSQDEISPCEYGQPGCTRELFLQHLVTRRHVYRPNTTPAYSNAAFATLGLVLEAMTNLTYGEALIELLTEPLGLKSTSAEPPQDSTRGVIVGDEGPTSSGWNLSFDRAGYGMGAIFSSPNDLSTVGRSILSSALLPDFVTRAWLKPVSHTSSLIGAVGRPWEIYRAVVGKVENNRVVDLYTKAGNVAGFGSNLVLIPDYDVGIVVMMAGRRGRTSEQILGMIVDRLLPALEEQAREEADARFAGRYFAMDRPNTSIILSSKPDVPGLSVDTWIINGTDIAAKIFGSPETFQLYPTNIGSDNDKQVVWRLGSLFLNDFGPFSACPSWVGLDRPTYGIYGLDEFIFHLGDDGEAVGLELRAMKTVLERK